MAGCASPGPPRAPSLQLPAQVSDLQATRRGDAVELQFAVPVTTTEGLPYRGGAMQATVCRAVAEGACVPVAALRGVKLSMATGSGAAAPAMVQDTLPAALTAGAARLLTYRVELSNAKGRTAGYGDAAYSAAGAAPDGVTGLRAEGSRQGVTVRWQADGAAQNGGSEVVLRREVVSGSGRQGGARAADGGGERTEAGGAGSSGKRQRPGRATPAKGSGTEQEPGVVWLSTSPAGDPLGGTAAPVRGPKANGALDDSAAVDSTYRYAAERQHTVQLGGHTVTVHSALSAPVEVALRAVYPPPAPTDLVGTVFPLAAGDAGGGNGAAGARLAVDLIWTPADDAKTVGYNVVREVAGGGQAGVSSRLKLTDKPVRMPAFHDVLPAELAGTAGAAGSIKLQYSVTAVDASGMESAPVVTVVETGGR